MPDAAEILDEYIHPNPGEAGPPPPASPDTGGAPEGGGTHPDVAAPPKSVRESIEDAKKELSARQIAAADRARDPTGKFAPDAKEKAPEASLKLQEPSAVTTEAKQAPVVASAPPSQPPPGWSAESKATWASLPPQVINDIAKREKEVSDGFAQYSQRQKELDAVIAPRRQYYAGENISDTEAVNRLWTWFEALQNKPHEAFPALAQTFGFNLNQVTPANGGDRTNPANPAYDPRVDRVASEVAQIRQQFAAQEQGRVAAELAAFGKDKPHFDNQAVKTAMGRLMQAGLATSLDDAYQKAVKLDPDVAAQIAADERTKAEATRAQAALTSSAQPRVAPQRAAVSIKGGAPGNAAFKPNGAGNKRESVRESLERTISNMRS